MNQKIFTIATVFLIGCFLLNTLVLDYRRHVKDSTIDSYEACRVFNEGNEGELYCIKYARDNSHWSPYIDPIGLFL